MHHAWDTLEIQTKFLLEQLKGKDCFGYLCRDVSVGKMLGRE
jgi:hypothetical protein